jgi:transcriptional regulator with XRE-family HTH domain
MEFNEKLQELRKQKGLTQEELAEKLYVSRAAISKWESGRGYPSIDSLKAISSFFTISLDELLSSNELLSIAEDDNNKKKKRFCGLIYGLLDVCASLLLFLPLFAEKNGDSIKSISLIMLNGVQSYLKICLLTIIISTVIFGILTLALQNLQARYWSKCRTTVSLSLSSLALLLFIICSQLYAAILAFALLMIKALLIIKRK